MGTNEGDIEHFVDISYGTEHPQLIGVFLVPCHCILVFMVYAVYVNTSTVNDDKYRVGPPRRLCEAQWRSG